jgi:hypothetical protein
VESIGSYDQLEPVHFLDPASSVHLIGAQFDTDSEGTATYSEFYTGLMYEMKIYNHSKPEVESSEITTPTCLANQCTKCPEN